MSDPVTPNMNLIQPIPGVDSGVSAANSYNANFTIVDQHNHSTGSGVQITPSGLNINASLTFNNQAATGVGYVGITTQGSGIPTPVNYSIYFSGAEFYVKDGAGNAVQITSGGLVNATSSGISSGTASASFVGSVLVVNADTNKPANVQMASVLLGNNVTSSNYITLSPPNALASSYALVLPAIPASTLFMTIDSSGNIGTSTGIAATQISAGAISGSQLANKTITSTQIADATITGTQIGSSITLAGAPTLATLSSKIGPQFFMVSTPAASSPYKIVAGVCPLGGGGSGDGWTQVRNSTGSYTVTFTSGNHFNSIPVVTLTAEFVGSLIVTRTSAATNSGFSYAINDPNGTPADSAASFIAVGLN